jgi:hypothetical protein
MREIPPARATSPDRNRAEGAGMATNPPSRDRRVGGISVGGIIVIVGILVLIFWSLWLGILIILLGLIAFGGFVRGRWY